MADVRAAVQSGRGTGPAASEDSSDLYEWAACTTMGMMEGFLRVGPSGSSPVYEHCNLCSQLHIHGTAMKKRVDRGSMEGVMGHLVGLCATSQYLSVRYQTTSNIVG